MTIIILLFTCLGGWAQNGNRFVDLRQKLVKMSESEPGLKEQVELSVSEISIQEFLRGIAEAHQLNVSVDPSLQVEVTNNFSDADVIDVLMYLCRQHDLDIVFIGSILSFSAYVAPEKEPEPLIARKINVKYEVRTNFLSVDLKKDTLAHVAKAITEVAGINVILAPGIDQHIVSAFIQNRPFKNTLEKLAYANGLKLKETTDNFFILEKVDDPEKTAEKQDPRTVQKNKRKPLKPDMDLDLKINDQLITLEAEDTPIKDLIKLVSDELDKNFFLFNDPDGKATLYIENATYDEFLTYLLNGTDYTHKNEGNIYLIGKRQLERLRTTELVQMQNRTIESVMDVIPAELKKGVEIKEFVELNGLILTGSYPNVNEVKAFLKQIDKVVPVVMIDVMIVNVSNSKTLSTGISMGIGENTGNGTSTTGPSGQTRSSQYLPEYNVNLNADDVNKVINGINGFGILNLGKVTPDFYLSIKAMEANGILKMRSTPKLATINGHEANMTIGQTDYYLETSNTINSGINNVVTSQQNWKSVQADLSITIKPFVSGDEQVTLEIEVSQSDFTGKSGVNAPPGSETRQFNSVIRVRNEEMILMGGLERKLSSEEGKGLPLISRIPVLKWIFGQRTRESDKSKLNVFIKPTIIY
ncbi:hypothetical protein KFE98_19150 [bacterium SCSIO 12741]|nr:hypothetical protein KFE98_19150 [bacterium SCSIO 12741]